MIRHDCHNRDRTRPWRGATITCAYSFDPNVDHEPCRGCKHFQRVYPGDEWAFPHVVPHPVRPTEERCSRCQRERLMTNNRDTWCPRCDL